MTNLFRQPPRSWHPFWSSLDHDQRLGRELDHQRTRWPALDLLLVTQITPTQFLLGRLIGVLYVTKEMVVLPLALCSYLWWQGGLTTENLCYVLIGLVTMYLFVTMLGIHCGMIPRSIARRNRHQPGNRLLFVPGRGDVHAGHAQFSVARLPANCHRSW